MQIDGIILRTKDPALDERGLPEYPNLPATTESFKVNEIRRTLVFDNLHPSVSACTVFGIYILLLIIYIAYNRQL